MAAKRAIIAELLHSGRPDLANVVAYGRIVTADAKDLADAADRLLGPFVKTIQSRADRVVKLADEWAVRGDFSSRKIKIALTKLIQEHEKITKLTAPSNLRPREKEHLQQTFDGKKMVLDSLKGEHKALGKLNHHDTKATERFIRGLKREAEFSVELMKMSIENIKEWASMLVSKEFKLGKFDVIDDYGIHERVAEPWFGAVTRASKILEKAGFGYLLYGELHLALDDNWGGMYYSKGDRVDLYLTGAQRSKPELLINTLVHELGHRLWFKFMDAGQRDQFSAPWIDQEGLLRDVYENFNIAMEIPVDEREEGWRTAWQSRFDAKKIKKWVEKTPDRALRWYSHLRRVSLGRSFGTVINKGKWNDSALTKVAEILTRVNDQRQEALRKLGELNQHDLSDERKARLKEDYEEEIGYHENSLSTMKAELYDAWVLTANDLLTMDELRDAFEPGGLDTKHPKAQEIQQVLKLYPVEPSVTQYGQTNRKEDFAETFEEVLMGRERSHKVMVRLQRALPRGSKVLSRVTAAAAVLYHTTSLKNLLSIVQQQKLIPKRMDNPFVSFGERPYFGDIRHNEAVLVFDRKALSDVMKVEYNEQWFDRYPDQGAYIAGEGWHAQYEPPPECFEYDEEEGWEEEDEECLQAAYHDAEVGAFMAKSDEREWISKREHQPVKFRPEYITGVLLKKGSVEAMEKELWKLGLDHVEVRKI